MQVVVLIDVPCRCFGRGCAELQALWSHLDSTHAVSLLQVTKVVIPPARPDKPNREFGFVHFNDRSVVENLVQDAEKGTKPSLDGSTLEVPLLTPCPHQMMG